MNVGSLLPCLAIFLATFIEAFEDIIIPRFRGVEGGISIRLVFGELVKMGEKDKDFWDLASTFGVADCISRRVSFTIGRDANFGSLLGPRGLAFCAARRTCRGLSTETPRTSFTIFFRMSLCASRFITGFVEANSSSRPRILLVPLDINHEDL